MSNRIRAEELFEQMAKKNMSSFSIVGFKRTFTTLHNRVIIPAMLKFSEDVIRINKQLALDKDRLEKETEELRKQINRKLN